MDALEFFNLTEEMFQFLNRYYKYEAGIYLPAQAWKFQFLNRYYKFGKGYVKQN